MSNTSKNATWGLILRKQEMTRMWVDGVYTPVTLCTVPSQAVSRWKTEDKDWYTAAVVTVTKPAGAEGKPKLVLEKEFLFAAKDDSWSPSTDQLTTESRVTIVWVSKGKWFQWVMKRHNFGWWPATHWSKFHRAAWSTWNRKPRRTIRGQKMAGRMGTDQVTLKKVPVVDVLTIDGQQVVALKGSLPGAYNSLLTIYC